MKNILNHLLLLCAVMMAGATFTACSSSDDDIAADPQQQNGQTTYTLTIKASMAVDATRALVLNESATGDELDAQWSEGDKVSVYKGSTLLGTLEATEVSQDGHECKLTGSINGTLQAGDYLQLMTPHGYPVDYRGQTGTLEDIADKYDYAESMVEVNSIDNGEVILEGQENVATFENSQSVVKFTLLDENNQPLNAQKLTIIAGFEYGDGDGGQDLILQHINYVTREYGVGDIDIVPSTADGASVIWAAIKMGIEYTDLIPVVEQPIGARQTREPQEVPPTVIILTANVGDKVYTCIKEGIWLDKGKFYEINVKMREATPLEAATPNDLGRVVGADGKLYANVAAATAAQTTAEAMIAYVGHNWGFFRHGLAISLTDVYEYNATYAQATGEYIIPTWAQNHAVEGGKWRLPDATDWQYMLWNYYASEPQPTDISGFNSLLTNAGGAPLVTDGYYWTSDEDDENDANALCVYQDNTNAAGFSAISKNFFAKVRACLPF